MLIFKGIKQMRQENDFSKLKIYLGFSWAKGLAHLSTIIVLWNYV